MANFSLTLTPIYGSYPAVVTFTLSGLPSGASATFSPSTVSVAAGPQTVALAIQTSTVASNGSVPSRREATPLTLALLLLPIAGARRWRRSERKMARYVTLALLLGVTVAGSAGLSGCVGNGSGSTQQNYTVTVTASAGTVQHVTTVTLTVQ